jgi:hypothetical protein
MTKLPPRIKVFKTRIGFDEVVVATSSKKAALEAWDVSRDLFRDGEAEVTSDPAAIKLALENIGKPVALPRKAARAAPAKRRKS